MNRPPRRSTLVISGIFLAAVGAYIPLRPEPRPPEPTPVYFPSTTTPPTEPPSTEAPPDTEIDTPGIQSLQKSELLRDDQRVGRIP